MPFNFDDPSKPYSQKLNEFSQYLTKQLLFERPPPQSSRVGWIATATIKKLDFGRYTLTYESAICDTKKEADENVCYQALEYLKFSPECLNYLVERRIISRTTWSFQEAQVEGRRVFVCTMDCPDTIRTVGDGASPGLAYESACARMMHNLWARGVRP